MIARPGEVAFGTPQSAIDALGVIAEGAAIRARDSLEAECVLELDRLSARDLVNLRGALRRAAFVELKVRSADHHVATLFGEEIEAYFSGLVAGRLQVPARFLQWPIDAKTASRLAPRLATVKSLYLMTPRWSAMRFVNEVRNNFGDLRYAVMRADAPDEEFTIAHTSPFLRDGGANWFATSVGAAFSTFPDLDYATWTIRNYREVVAGKVPVTHQVSIDLHMGSQRRYRQDYVRLTLPFQHDDIDGVWIVSYVNDLNFDLKPPYGRS